MHIRAHRGFLTDSLEPITEIPPAKTAMIAFLHEHFPSLPPVTEECLCVEPYVPDQWGWHTHVVILNHYGVRAFPDGPLQE